MARRWRWRRLHLVFVFARCAIALGGCLVCKNLSSAFCWSKNAAINSTHRLCSSPIENTLPDDRRGTGCDEFCRPDSGLWARQPLCTCKFCSGECFFWRNLNSLEGHENEHRRRLAPSAEATHHHSCKFRSACLGEKGKRKKLEKFCQIISNQSVGG